MDLTGALWIVAIALVTVLSVFAMGLFSKTNQMPVEGKTVLITGASEGMGRCAALQMAQKGANVIIVSRSAKKLAGVVTELKAAARSPDSQRFHFLTADVSKHDYADPLLTEAVAWNNGQPLDIVWCIAGMSAPNYWLEVPLSVSRAQMDINYWGAAEMAHAILRRWCARDAPVVEEAKHVIFTSSVLAFLPVVGYGPYTPPKSALRALADTLVQETELYPQKVKIHVVYPGTIDSPGLARENQTKPEVTQQIEADDPVQSPEAVAAGSIAGLENGEYAVTTNFIGHAMRWSALGGSVRNNWVVDTVMCWIMQIVWMIVLPDIFGKIRKYARANGHPSTYGKNKDAA